MKRSKFYIRVKRLLAIFSVLITSYSCEKDLNQVVYDKLSTSTFFKTADDAKAAVTASYRGMASFWSNNRGTQRLDALATDEGIAVRPNVEGYTELNELNLFEDFTRGIIFNAYFNLMPVITEITINMDKISAITMDENLKARLIAELTGLRAIYSYQILNLYGAMTIPIDPKIAADPAAEFVPRPTTAAMVTQIESDYKAAAAVLPPRFTGNDYGRISKAACLTGLMKLYMHEKRWSDAVTVGNQIKGLGYSLMPDYDGNFTLKNKGGNNEIILAVPARPDLNGNLWLQTALPETYRDPSGQSTQASASDVFRMPWKTFDKFDASDLRAKRLLAKYPTVGGVIYDVRAHPEYPKNIGAVVMKYGLDPAAIGALHGIDMVVCRYADVLLLLAEAINETQGPTAEAYSLINEVRKRAGLNDLIAGLTKDQFRNKLMDERLFELWCEGVRREDLIRWGTFIKRAIDDGSVYAKPEFVLYPLPRQVISESGGIIKQNPGY
ncbi:MAG: RagB/SusD family nutrient uptake outer membrane protein [Pedobacter sp.]|jgi:hypothetical protein